MRRLRLIVASPTGPNLNTSPVRSPPPRMVTAISAASVSGGDALPSAIKGSASFWLAVDIGRDETRCDQIKSLSHPPEVWYRTTKRFGGPSPTDRRYPSATNWLLRCWLDVLVYAEEVCRV